MERFRRLILVFGLVSPSWGFLHTYPNITLGARDGGDPGKPLFLTPYIETGNITEGRSLARVPFTDSIGVESYAGYFTVDKKYDSNQFFWYFPAMTSKDEIAPVVVWLAGGPGASGLYGIFMANGPMTVVNGTLDRRRYHWALNHHVIYIDNPVGTGFSFTNDSRGYCTDEIQVGEQLYSTLIQFFKLFPELQQNRFFVTGVSYGGKYAPALAYTIHKKNPTAEIKINMKGIAIGNGLSDPENQLLYGKYLYQIGLIDSNQVKVFQKYENKVVKDIRNKHWDEAFDTLDTLISGRLMYGKSVFHNTTGFDIYMNYLHTKDYLLGPHDFGPLIQTSAVRRSIHVGDKTFHSTQNSTEVFNNLKRDIMKSVAPWISELLDHYDVLIYNGQLDIIVAYPLTVNYLKHLNFNGADKYKTAKRRIWRVDGEIAGYVKQAGKLVEVLVRNAGHMVTVDQPKWGLDLITRFTNGKPFHQDFQLVV